MRAASLPGGERPDSSESRGPVRAAPAPSPVSRPASLFLLQWSTSRKGTTAWTPPRPATWTTPARSTGRPTSPPAPPACPTMSPAVLRQGPGQAQLWDALLFLPGHRLHGAEAADHRARVLLRGEGETQLLELAGLLQDQLHLHVSAPAAAR